MNANLEGMPTGRNANVEGMPIHQSKLIKILKTEYREFSVLRSSNIH